MILGVVQVRFDSTRLPGKALKDVCGKPLLWHVYERASRSQLANKTVIAVADTESNRPIMQFAEDNGIEYFAGSELDLTDRLLRTAEKFGADILVRVTGDCPLIDPGVMDRTIRFYLDQREPYDFVSNGIEPTFPHGLDVGVLPVVTLKRLHTEIQDPFWREWLTSYMRERPESFCIGHCKNETDLSALRWTVDYEDDLVFVREVFRRLYPNKPDFAMEDILTLLHNEPLLQKINHGHVRNSAYIEAKKEAQK